MIDEGLSFHFFWFLERLLVGLIFFYFVFSVLVAKQVERLASSVKTNLSTAVLVLSLFHLMVGLLCFIAALGLVFQ